MDKELIVCEFANAIYPISILIQSITWLAFYSWVDHFQLLVVLLTCFPFFLYSLSRDTMFFYLRFGLAIQSTNSKRPHVRGGKQRPRSGLICGETNWMAQQYHEDNCLIFRHVHSKPKIKMA